MIWILAAAGIFILIGGLYLWTSPGMTLWRRDHKRRKYLSPSKARGLDSHSPQFWTAFTSPGIGAGGSVGTGGSGADCADVGDFGGDGGDGGDCD